MTTPQLDLIVAWQEHMRLAGKSGYTIESWGHALQRAHDQLPYGLDGASGHDLMHWLAHPDWSRATRASYRSALVSFYQWACDPADPQLDSDPAIHLPRIRRDTALPRPCGDDELAHILANAAEPYKLWALLAAYEGARCIEISRLDRNDITEAATRLHGKGDKRRTVPTHPDVWDAVAALPGGPIADRDARRISRDAQRHLVQVVGLPAMSLHRLRHWYLTTIQRLHRDLRVTQELAGHSSPDTTAVYTAVADDQRVAAVMSLPRLGRGDAFAAAVEAAPHAAR